MKTILAFLVTLVNINHLTCSNNFFNTTDNRTWSRDDNNNNTNKLGRHVPKLNRGIYHVPPCTNAILQHHEFLYHNNNESLTTTIGFTPVTFNGFKRLNDSSAEVCFPLSPQLQTCSKREYQNVKSPILTTTTFRITNHTLYLHQEGDHQELKLGDYFASADNEDRVITCDEQIHQVVADIPRCNYINLSKNEYDQLGNGSSGINSTGKILKSHASNYTLLLTEQHKTDICFPLNIHLINCKGLANLFETEFRIAKNHSLYIKDDKIYTDIGDYFLTADGMAHTCIDNSDLHPIKNAIKVYFVTCNVLSAVCLAMTAWYQGLKKIKPSRHARCLLNHLLTLLVANVCTAINNTWDPHPSEPHSPSKCYVLFIVTYLAYMWTFFWLNVLAFDVWLSFLSMPTSKYYCSWDITEAKRFACYNIYAWTIPLILCAVVLLADQYRNVQIALWINPDIISYCWFGNRRAILYFFYVPLIFIIGSNVIFFISTTCCIKFANTDQKFERRHGNVAKFIVCLKLFAIMGLTYLLHIAFWSLGDVTVYTLWFVAEAFSSLQGVAVCLVYVCKIKNGRKICKYLKN